MPVLSLHESNKKNIACAVRGRRRRTLAALASGGDLFLRMVIKRNIKAILAAGIMISFPALTRSLAIAGSRIISPRIGQPHNGIALETQRKRILRVLENRMEGQNLPESAKDKLSKLSDEQIRLLDSLAVRMIKSNHTAASDIAFFLITTLIILSDRQG
jgi:hypothetical protein